MPNDYYDLDDELESLSGFLGEGRWEEESVRQTEEYEDDTEARRPRYRRGPSQLPIKRAPFRPVSGVAGANIQTPAGRAQVQFGKPLATQEGVNNLARELKAEIAGLAASVKKLNETLDKNTAILDGKVNGLEKQFRGTQEQNQMATLLPLLLNKPPQIEKIVFKKGDTTEEHQVSTTVFKKDNNLGLILALTMSGGLGKGSDSALMALAVSGAL